MSRDTSFYYSFLVLPARKRQAIVAVWDFCRALDDAVDEVSPASGEQTLTPEARQSVALELRSWRAELDAVYGMGREPQTRQGKALQPFVRQFGLPRQEFSLLIDGVEMDLDRVRYQEFAALERYCRHVAGTVGLICLEIFGYQDQGSRDYAMNLAVALQLTNIVRDVAADLEQGRIYLPAEDLVRFQVTEADLGRGVVTPGVRALLAFECSRAREHFRRASAGLPRRDRHQLVAAQIMGGIYFGILERIEQAGYDVFSSRIRVPRPARLLIALRIWLRSRLGLPTPLG